jgi:hypothetical protein
MKDYTISQDKIKNIDKKNFGGVSSPFIPVSPDPSKRKENVKAIIDTILCMVPGAVVISVKNINGLVPDVKSHCVISRQRKQKDGFNRKQLELYFGTSELANKGGAS